MENNSGGWTHGCSAGFTGSAVVCCAAADVAICCACAPGGHSTAARRQMNNLFLLDGLNVFCHIVQPYGLKVEEISLAQKICQHFFLSVPSDFLRLGGRCCFVLSFRARAAGEESAVGFLSIPKGFLRISVSPW
jgi:hypothetical protein